MGNTCNSKESNQPPSPSNPDNASLTNNISILTKPVLVYWDLHGRSDFAQAMLYAGNIPFDLDQETANSWPASKDDTPFGQIPVLKHGNLVIGQGGAITRYCARLAGLYPCSGEHQQQQQGREEAAVCDMYLEEMMDIFSGIFQVRGRIFDLDHVFFLSFDLLCFLYY